MVNDKIEEKRQAIADAIIKSFETNEAKWAKGWYALSSMPQNGKTGRAYSGTNLLVLLTQAENKDYNDPRWITFMQAQDLGASIKAGERATAVFHYNEYDALTKKPPDWEAIRKLPKDEQIKYDIKNIRRSISYHSVFNAEQVKDMPAAALPKMSAEESQNSNEIIERIIENSPAPIYYGGGRAYYNETEDKIRLPYIADFKTKQDYYSTALHEISHATGHKSRLNRFESQHGIKDYAVEELRATFASIFLQSELGIKIEGEHWENHGSYLKNWSSFIKDDKDILFKTIKEASNIATFVRENYAKLENDKNKENETQLSSKTLQRREENAEPLEGFAVKHGLSIGKANGFLKASQLSAAVKPFNTVKRPSTRPTRGSDD